MVGSDVIEKVAADVFQALFNRYKISRLRLIGPTRRHEVVRVRQIMCAVLYKNGLGQSQIARLLNRDHTTIIHAIQTAEFKWKEEIESLKLAPFDITSQKNPYAGKSKRYEWIYKLYGGKCVICGFSSVVQVHHLIPRSIGGSDDVTNLIVLCPNHHAMLHLGLVDISNLSTPKQPH